MLYQGNLYSWLSLSPSMMSPVQWDRAEWPEGDAEGAPIVYFMEFNAAGEVLRQVELAGQDEHPIAAASLAEFWEAQGWRVQAATPALLEYQERYGSLADGTRSYWGPDYPGVAIRREDFEAVWERARAFLSSKTR